MVNMLGAIWRSVVVRAALVAAMHGAAMAQSAAPPPGAEGRATGEQALYLQALAATCANCHGTRGQSQPGSSITSLAGLDKGYIVKQMKDFQSGARPATVMHQLSKGYSDSQIDALAGYFAAQPKPLVSRHSPNDGLHSSSPRIAALQTLDDASASPCGLRLALHADAFVQFRHLSCDATLAQAQP